MAKTDALSVTLAPSPKAGEALALVQQAKGLAVHDRPSHEACRTFIKGAKALQREIEDHYARLKRPINDARNTLLSMEKEHLSPVQQAIGIAEQTDITYVREQERLEREEADRRRQAAEEEARRKRDADVAELERQRVAAEESQSALSEREAVMLKFFAASGRSATDAAKAAQRAGYTDIPAAVKRLLHSAKLQAGLQAIDRAKALQEQEEALKAAPVNVVAPAPIVSEIGAVAGTSLRTYYSCDDQVDLTLLVRAWLGGKVPSTAIQPNMVYLNAEARNLKELFPQAFPGCRLTKRQGIAG